MGPKETCQSLHPGTLAQDLNSAPQLVLDERAGSEPGTWAPLGKVSEWERSLWHEPSLVGDSELSDSSKGLSPIHMKLLIMKF